MRDDIGHNFEVNKYFEFENARREKAKYHRSLAEDPAVLYTAMDLVRTWEAAIRSERISDRISTGYCPIKGKPLTVGEWLEEIRGAQ